jgi:hypothetical protein
MGFVFHLISPEMITTPLTEANRNAGALRKPFFSVVIVSRLIFIGGRQAGESSI